MYFVYMIKNSFGDLYTGVTSDPEGRLKCHNSHGGSQFTRNKALFSIVFLESYESFSVACRREIQIKKWRRNKKELLVKRFLVGLPTKLQVCKTKKINLE